MILPSGPKTNSFLQLAQWLRDPVNYLESTAAQFGDVFTMRVGSKALVVLSDPQSLQTMFTNPAVAAPGEINEMARRMLGNNSIFALSGEKHQQRRMLLMPAFHNERIGNYGQIIKEITQQVMQKQPQHSFLVRDAMQDITMQVILHTVFGLRSGEPLEQLRQRLVDRFDMTASGIGLISLFLPPLQKEWGPWGKIIEKQKECDELFYAQIRERRSNFEEDRTDILNLLLSAKDERGEGWTDSELRDELMALFFAGQETAATALTWALYWIHKNPEILSRLKTELREIDLHAEPMTVFKLPYLTAVCQETLRIYSPVLLTLPRIVRSPVEIGGHILEPGTEVVGSIYLAHHRAQVYPQPKQFKPERFLEGQFSPYEYIPFGGGSRRCIGYALGLFEIKLVLATILQQEEMALLNDRPLLPKRRGALLAPQADFSMAKLVRQKTLTQAIIN